MVYEAAKSELAQATSMSDRTCAVEKAMVLGMPLDLIETYLDWLDAVRPLPDYASPDISPDAADGAEPLADADPGASRPGASQTGSPNPIE